MADSEQLPLVADAICQLRDIGLQPVLVGEMALVIVGSLRVTRDFDFVIAHPADKLRLDRPTSAYFYSVTKRVRICSRLCCANYPSEK